MAALPYVTAPRNIEKALNGIKAAATPESVSQDFVKTILGIKGGSGNQITSYLKKIGFAASDGKPTEIYTTFRNSRTSGQAVVRAMKHGYAPLYNRNEFMHKLDDEALKGLVIEETGAGDDSSVPYLIVACISALKKFADFSAPKESDDSTIKSRDPESRALAKVEAESARRSESSTVGLNLSYTINLNLPATTDIAVFNAIFKSLQDNLLRRGDE